MVGRRAKKSADFLVARQTALLEGDRVFIANCNQHGEGQHLTQEGVCAACWNEHPELTPGERAARLNAVQFKGHCAVHGETWHVGRQRLCQKCFTKAGVPRPIPAPATARAQARAARCRQFIGACPIHGETPFGTWTGKCLKCNTAKGHPREREVRTAARLAGELIYTDWCDTHGAALHDVSRGLCLYCRP